MAWWNSIFKKRSSSTAISNDLQGVVRGFKESRQLVPQYNFRLGVNQDSELLVWTFQLERHNETGERLEPIPVEMSGKFFSGTINEGNVIRLYEKSWDGGVVRTKRVYDVTFEEDIKAHTDTVANRVWSFTLNKEPSPTAISNDLQGVVVGFRESRQINIRFLHPSMESIVWTFMLDRHSATGERKDPIPVEMRGKNFTGFINDGHEVRLYEKSWRGGIVRTKRVLNVTLNDVVKAH
jgi:hypothetical protein